MADKQDWEKQTRIRPRAHAGGDRPQLQGQGPAVRGGARKGAPRRSSTSTTPCATAPRSASGARRSGASARSAAAAGASSRRPARPTATSSRWPRWRMLGDGRRAAAPVVAALRQLRLQHGRGEHPHQGGAGSSGSKRAQQGGALPAGSAAATAAPPSPVDARLARVDAICERILAEMKTGLHLGQESLAGWRGRRRAARQPRGRGLGADTFTGGGAGACCALLQPLKTAPPW